MIVDAPFTEKQIANLKSWQTHESFHPMTCRHDHGDDENILIPETEGMRCPTCNEVQRWVHDFMADLT